MLPRTRNGAWWIGAATMALAAAGRAQVTGTEQDDAAPVASRTWEVRPATSFAFPEAVRVSVRDANGAWGAAEKLGPGPAKLPVCSAWVVELDLPPKEPSSAHREASPAELQIAEQVRALARAGATGFRLCGGELTEAGAAAVQAALAGVPLERLELVRVVLLGESLVALLEGLNPAHLRVADCSLRGGGTFQLFPAKLRSLEWSFEVWTLQSLFGRVSPDLFAEPEALEELVLRGNGEVGRDTRFLSGFPNLRWLDLRLTSAFLTQEEVRKAAPKLEVALLPPPKSEWNRSLFLDQPRLELVGRTIEDAELKDLPRAPAVTQLVLRGNNIRDEGLAGLAVFPALRELSLAGNPVIDHGLIALPVLEQLEVLDLSGSRLRGASLGELARQPRLRSIDLSGCLWLTEEGWGRLSSSNLEVLVAARVPLTGWRFLERGQLPQLAEVDLSQSEVSDEGLAAMARLPSLRKLVLAGCLQITSEGIAALAPAANLETLSLRDTLVGGKGVMAVKELRQLKHLVLPKDCSPDSPEVKVLRRRWKDLEVTTR